MAVIGAKGGKGGGGGGQRAPVEAPNTLRSKQYARVLDLLCEGEIEGLVNGLQSVYLDDVVVQNSDGTFNFNDVSIMTRYGTQAQSYMDGFPETESENAVGIEVTNATPVVRSITNANVGAVRVTILIPRLYAQNTTNGDINGTSVSIAIDVQDNGGGYVEKVADTISGKTMAGYQRDYRIALTGNGPWDIRVRRVTADNSSATLANKTFFSSYTEIIPQRFRYPNSAYVGLQVDASQFQRIPTRAYDVKLLKVKIPSNYDPVTRTYTGNWDGTFKAGVYWTDNPAWCFYDLITNERYGLGKFVSASQIDKWALYKIGQYCDESVSDGFGGEEPRFTCNVYLNTRQEAFRVLAAFASVFRAMIWWSAGSLSIAQDAPASVTAVFTRANVIDGVFTYSGSDLRSRHTVALVTWNDPSDGYRQKIEYVPDPDGIAKYGIREADVVAFGATSRGQAHRFGRWLLYSERLETETVTFQVGLDGTTIYPGALIQTQDPTRAGARLGGRVKSATTTTITLDSPVTLKSGVTYTLLVMLPDGTLGQSTVTTGAGTISTVTVSPALAAAPQAQAIWVLSSSEAVPETWRVVTVKEVGENKLEISAVAHNSSKFGFIEQGLTLETPKTSLLTTAPGKPTGLTTTESLVLLSNGTVGNRVTLSWDPDSSVSEYRVTWTEPNGNPNSQTVRTNEIDIVPAMAGSWHFEVTAYNAILIASPVATLDTTLLGLTAPPSDISNFSVAVIGSQAHLTWTRNTELDLSHYEIRYTSVTSGATWASAMALIPNVPPTAASVIAPALQGTYLIKAVDTSGNLSVNAASVVVTTNTLDSFNAVLSIPESTTWGGTFTDTGIVGGWLQLTGSDTLSDWTTLAAIDSMTYGTAGVISAGSYQFADTVDLGKVFTSRITASVTVTGTTLLSAINTWATLAGVEALSGTDPSKYGVQLEVRTTTDDPNAAPTWTAWQPFVVGDYTARGLQFRVSLTTTETNVTPIVQSLTVNVDMPDRVATGNDVAVPAGGLTITFSPSFKATPAIAVNGQNLNSGDYWRVTNKSASGFTLQFFDSTNSGVARTADWVAKGWGYGT